MGPGCPENGCKWKYVNFKIIDGGALKMTTVLVYLHDKVQYLAVRIKASTHIFFGIAAYSSSHTNNQ